MLSASGSEECLSKLRFSFLVFGKRKEAWRVVTGSNKVGFDSWQGELEILICFLVGKGTSYRTAAKLLCLL